MRQLLRVEVSYFHSQHSFLDREARQVFQNQRVQHYRLPPAAPSSPISRCTSCLRAVKRYMIDGGRWQPEKRNPEQQANCLGGVVRNHVLWSSKQTGVRSCFTDVKTVLATKKTHMGRGVAQPTNISDMGKKRGGHQAVDHRGIYPHKQENPMSIVAPIETLRVCTPPKRQLNPIHAPSKSAIPRGSLSRKCWESKIDSTHLHHDLVSRLQSVEGPPFPPRHAAAGDPVHEN